MISGYFERVKTVIHWFRRDLRIHDNTALNEAAKRAERVVPVFIAEEALRTGPDVGAARLAFLFESIESLRKNLEHLGHQLVMRRGRSEDVLVKLCREVGAEAVFANRRYEPYALARDERIRTVLSAEGIGFEIFKDAVVWDGREILTQAGNPFTVFTPYSKAWKKLVVPPPVPSFQKTDKIYPTIPCDPLPENTADFGFSLKQTVPAAGERAAKDVLHKFMDDSVWQYALRRDFPDAEGTSQFSPHLRVGTIGIRTILSKLANVSAKALPVEQKSCEVFLNELIWREFYLQVLHNFPHVTKGCFRPEYDALKWSNNQEHFKAWCEGMTGYPIVDAAMRCLNATGWMHNRLRMIVAMFLTKDLMLPWQWGERYFMQQLVDGDMAANNGGWQWSAGTGTDAAPYFRIFNPTSQATKFDADGKFVKKWVPELMSLGPELIHEPWNEPLLLQRLKYPERIVLHELQREKCLAMFKAVKKQVEI